MGWFEKKLIFVSVAFGMRNMSVSSFFFASDYRFVKENYKHELDIHMTSLVTH